MDIYFLKTAYQNGWLTAEQIKNAVTKGFITQADCDGILGAS